MDKLWYFFLKIIFYTINYICSISSSPGNNAYHGLIPNLISGLIYLLPSADVILPDFRIISLQSFSVPSSLFCLLVLHRTNSRLMISSSSSEFLSLICMSRKLCVITGSSLVLVEIFEIYLAEFGEDAQVGILGNLELLLVNLTPVTAKAHFAQPRRSYPHLLFQD